MTMSAPHPTPSDALDFRLRTPASLRAALTAAGIALLALSALALFHEPSRRHFGFAWLVSIAFYTSIGLGALFFVLIHHLVGARWSVVLRRFAEALAMTLPLLAVLFLPVLIALPEVYHWAEPHAAEHDTLLHHKQPWLNAPFFTARAVLYFAVWVGLALWVYRRSLENDRTGDLRPLVQLRRGSAPAMIALAVTLTFAAFDWLMSLDPHWYSTIFGVYYFAGCAVAIYATMIVMVALLRRASGLEHAVTVEHFHDLGKMLFGFVVFWAYIAFSQFLLIWMANIPEETLYYLHRWESPGWRAVGWLLVGGHFVLPFLFLLPRTVKRTPPLLAAAAVWLLLMHYVDCYWLVMPTLDTEHLPLHWLDVALPLGMGCLVASRFLAVAARESVIPPRDPALAESMSFENA